MSKSPKSDRLLCELEPGKWGLGYDLQQWIVLRAKKRRDEAYWQAVAYVGSNKDVLRRVRREKLVDVTPEAEALLDALPERFLDWKAQGLPVPVATRQAAE